MRRLESWVVCEARAYGRICYVCNGRAAFPTPGTRRKAVI